ncbi:MAG TPA: class I adenylate-forming enzyme family protein [Acidimicrobiia bacterium]|nr:class I adenylate-forming enzyme family protein [Acidimicrobiia bacterium]
MSDTVGALVAEHAHAQPDGIAFVEGVSGRATTWREYDAHADAIAAALVGSGCAPGDRYAVRMPDGPEVHATYVGCERAGVVIVGIGPRAGEREVAHLLETTNAREGSFDDVVAGARPPTDRALGPADLWMLNSTSGTTGLPKCVMHAQQRWFAFHRLAVEAADLGPDDVFASALPAPFGFGLWTAHFTPAILGAPCVVFERFTADAVIAAVARYRVTVLAAVSTQFMMMLGSPALDGACTSLRVLFTGGEMVPPDRAAEFEARTGARVLQFYGSNETGALSRTTRRDDDTVRLHTAGRAIASMAVRIFDPDTGADVTATGGPGVGACRGPLTCLGYWDDPEANAQLVPPDGWMRTGDIVTIDRPGDPEGVLTVRGRASDFIIRGGKNISAAYVEEEVGSHPAVALCAAVAAPDPVFGERVCCFVVLRDGGSELSLGELTAHLATRGTGKEHWPELLVVVDRDLPRSSGGKVAKGELRARAAHHISSSNATSASEPPVGT